MYPRNQRQACVDGRSYLFTRHAHIQISFFCEKNPTNSIALVRKSIEGEVGREED